MKNAPTGKVVKATPVPKVMMEVEQASYVRLVRKVRDLQAENDKLTAHMKVISEAARESQTRSRFYSKREDAPAHKSVPRRNGKSVQGRNTGQVLRKHETVPVGGVQVPVNNSTKYQPRFTKGPSKTKPTPAKVGGKSSH